MTLAAARTRLRALFARPRLDRRALAGYRRERVMELTMPFALALIEGGFVGVLADKIYQVHPAVLAIVTAAPMFGNLSSFFWARVGHGRRKVPLVVALQAGVLVICLTIAVSPSGPAGAWILVGGMVAARLLIAGALTLRSTVWSLNYPRDVRARFTGRLQMLFTLTLATAGLAASLALDAQPESFRIMYAVSAAVALVGVINFARVPHLGEQEHLALERGEDPEAEALGGSRGMWRVLRDDREFAHYQGAQFLLGISNMMIEAPLLYLVSRQLGAGFLTSNAILFIVPVSIATLSIPVWAHYIDEVHVARFRVTQSGFWVSSQALTWLGAITGSLLLLIVARVVLGFARGGGSLAWQLGHNDFSSQRDLASYMGAHVTLTGIRGSFAPFLGMLLYVGFAGGTLPGLDGGPELPALPALGAHTFGLSCVLSTTSAVSFALLVRRIQV